MTRKTARDFSPAVLKLFDKYVHGDISRREFLDRAAAFAVAGVSAAALLESLSPDFAAGQRVPTDDTRLATSYVMYDSPQGGGTIRAYLAQPASRSGKLPGVVVIHENRGLNPHIEDIARRNALDGYIALAPDALTPLGGYPGNEDDARALFGKLDRDKLVYDFLDGVDYLERYDGCTGKVGAVGFCFGGGMVNQLAVRRPDLDAAVAFYGAQPAAEDVAKIKAPLMLHYAGLDERVNAGWPAYRAALDKAGVDYLAYTYDGVNHGFNNDTTPRYDEAAASLAWQRTMDFFAEHLR
jgi:carboxymethylenebutenolidase